MKPYYQDDSVTIYHGDNLRVLTELSSVDAIITDPPYSEYVHRSVRTRGAMPDALTRSNACRIRTLDLGFEHLTSEHMQSCSLHFARLCKRWVLVFCNCELSKEWIDSLGAAGLSYRRTGAWIKIGAPPQFSGDRPAQGFESIVIAHAKGRSKWNGGGRHGVWSHPIELARDGKTKRLHTAQKPIKLMSELVGLFSNEGETILDPFAGSGTTLRAAKDLGRKAIGIELEERYCEIAARRMGQEIFSFNA